MIRSLLVTANLRSTRTVYCGLFSCFFRSSSRFFSSGVCFGWGACCCAAGGRSLRAGGAARLGSGGCDGRFGSARF